MQMIRCSTTAAADAEAETAAASRDATLCARTHGLAATPALA